MAVEDLPLFDHRYDEPRNPMSRLLKCEGDNTIPERFLLSFMGDPLSIYVEKHHCSKISNYHSEVRDFPIYETKIGDVRIGLVQAPVGAPAAAILADLLIASGVRAIVACGGCGVLTPIESGAIIVPTRALRDEGTSFHYMEPSTYIDLDPDAIEAVESTLIEHKVPYDTCTTWTTDGFFRETSRLISFRRNQGCSVVEMECSSLAAVARCSGALFAEILYSGDSLAEPDNHDERSWLLDFDARTISFFMALSSLTKIALN